MSDPGENPESALLAQLRAQASPRASGDAFTVTRGAVSFRVAYSGGSSSSLDLLAPYDSVRGDARTAAGERGYRGDPRAARASAPRPLRIVLRAEEARDRRAKDEGINREVQTGDRDFDAAVYIDTASDDAVVRAVLAPPAVRAAVRELLDFGFASIEIDDLQGRVCATKRSFVSRHLPDERGAAIVDAFGALLAALPHFVADDAGPRARASRPLRTLLSLLAGAGFFGAVPAYFRMVPARCVVHDSEGSSLRCSVAGCCSPAYAGLLAAVVTSVVVTLALRPALRRRLRGHSNSTARLRAATWLTFALSGEVAFYVAAALAIARG